MRKKQILIILLIITLIAVPVSVTYAYMVRNSQTVSNQFFPATVACSVQEVLSGRDKTAITVKNDGNIDSYIRLRLVFCWADSKGDPVAKQLAIPSFEINSDAWIKDESDGYTYYCKTPIAPGASTPNLLKEGSKITMETTFEEYKNGQLTIKYMYYPVLEVVAEAIQSTPAQAAEDAWPAIDVDGNNLKKH